MRAPRRTTSIEITIVLFIALSLLATGCGGGAEQASPTTAAPGATQPPAPTETPKPPDEVTLRLGWTYGGMFSVLYLGVEKGFYLDEGIDLIIEQGQGTNASAQAVGGGTDDFGYIDASAAALLIDQGLPIRVVLQVRQLTSMAVIVSKASGVASLKDLEGRSIAFSAGASSGQLFPGLLALNGVDESLVTMVALDYMGRFTAVAQGDTDGLLGYTDWESLTLASMLGADQVINLGYADNGINVVDYGIVTSNELIESNPDLVRRFVAATIRSHDYALEHKDEAIDLGRILFPEADHDWVAQQLDQLADFIGPGLENDYHVDPAVWNRTLDLMNRYMGLTNTDPALYYTEEFLP